MHLYISITKAHKLARGDVVSVFTWHLVPTRGEGGQTETGVRRSGSSGVLSRLGLQWNVGGVWLSSFPLSLLYFHFFLLFFGLPNSLSINSFSVKFSQNQFL